MPLFLESIDIEWLTPDDLIGCVVGADPIKTEEAIALAGALLFRLSGQQFGQADITVRPYAVTHGRWTPNPFTAPRSPYRLCETECQLLRLPTRVSSVTSVTIDGEVLPLDGWRLYDSRSIVRTDGYHWPCCQDLSKEATEAGTWQIRYIAGNEIPPGGRAAAKILACEILKSLSNDASCRLSERVQTISRQGVTEVILDSQDYLEKMRTGLRVPDLWLMSVNPHGLDSQARVYNPDDYAFATE